MMNCEQKKAADAVSRPKLEVLDALRGFCALMVVVLHFSENYYGAPWSLHLLPHGCLPVEYFFILTGFTLVYAYDGKWERGLTLGSFFKRRVIRLQPLVVIGSIIGAACYLLSSEQYAGRIPDCNLWQLGLLTLWCSTMVPVPNLLGSNLLHPLQGPLWTLFYIYVANVLYAFVLRHLKTWMLAVLALAGIYMTYRFGMYGGGFHCGPNWCWWWGKGWPKSFLQVWNGTNTGAIARMMFPVLAGMVIARKGWKIRTGNAALWICIAILTFVFIFPEMRPVRGGCIPVDPVRFLAPFGLEPSKALNGAFEATAVVVGMPLVLLLGIGGEIRNAKLAAVCRFLGKYSLPLYCTHYSMTILHRVWRDAHVDAPWYMHFATVCACAFFALINAYVAMRLADRASDRLKFWYRPVKFDESRRI